MSNFITDPTGTTFPSASWQGDLGKSNFTPLPQDALAWEWWMSEDANAVTGALKDLRTAVISTSSSIGTLSGVLSSTVNVTVPSLSSTLDTVSSSVYALSSSLVTGASFLKTDVTASASIVVSASSLPAVVGGVTTGGVSATLAAWTAIAFAPSTSEIGSVAIMIKKDAGVADGGTTRAFLFSDTGAIVPNIDISDTSTGQPTIVFTQDIGTGFSLMRFRLPKTGLTPGAVYWVVLHTSVTGGNLYIDGASGAPANMLATAPDSGGSPGAWTGVAQTGAIIVYGSSGRAIWGYSPSHHAIEGVSSEGIAGFFTSVTGMALKGNSTDNIGTGGTSVNGIGLRGSSTNNFALQAISVNNAGAQVQGTMGMQVVATAGGSPAMQMVNTGGGNLFQGLDSSNGYAISSQIDSHGAGYLASSLQLGSAALPTAAAGLAGTLRFVSGTAGNADKLYCCLKAAAGTYSWVQVATG